MFGDRSYPQVPRGGFGLIVFVLCLVGLFMVYRAGNEEEAGRDAGTGQTAGSVTVEVDRVVDGDTAKVFYEGESEYVRYIGIDTPESVQPDTPVECFGEESKSFNASRIEGQEMKLVFDEEKRDRYGRLLAYVYVNGNMINAELLRLGYATTLEISPNTSKADQFANLEQDAREAGRGLWSAC